MRALQISFFVLHVAAFCGGIWASVTHNYELSSNLFLFTTVTAVRAFKTFEAK